MFSSLITKRQKNSVHVHSRPTYATVGKTPLCKIWKSVDAENLFYIHLNNVVLNFTEFKKKYLKIHEFCWIFHVHAGTEFSVSGSAKCNSKIKIPSQYFYIQITFDNVTLVYTHVYDKAGVLVCFHFSASSEYFSALRFLPVPYSNVL